MDTPKQLTLDQKLNVAYCIPSWLRDEQVRLATARVAGRIQEWSGPLRDEPVAIACFGPSLADTWEEIRKFKYIFSCSGSHKFLIDRGIIPTHHLEVDPRTHKIELLGPPHKDVEYLIASACHPKYFDHLAGFNVKLWHIFSNEEEAFRILPPGEWALTGGCSVGLRCLTLARFLGFRDMHIFGMDGSEGATGKHAAYHPNQAKKHALVTHNGVEYRTTSGFLEAAKQTKHELDLLKDVTVKFYGEGLVQAMMKDYVRTETGKETILALAKPVLISGEYRKLNAALHHDNLAYGVGGGKHAPTVEKLSKALTTQSVLDYGCGKGYLAKALTFPIWEYDPAVPNKAESPRPADLVVCTDVLEHIEPENLLPVLADLRRCTRKMGYFIIHTGPSGKLLSDGRNAHLIQQDRAWWETQLAEFFTVAKILQAGPLLHCVVTPKKVKLSYVTKEVA
jgi:2-polyprenyl-3-methyl-5-hydroxy-6-metoxy-1,4-benzoquinol methylase